MGREQPAAIPMRVDKLLVTRLWALYAWPERNLPMRKMTVEKILTYPSQPVYVSDHARTVKQPPRAWDYGRIRFFYEQILIDAKLTPIEVDYVKTSAWIAPELIVLDGHHRLAASHLAGAKIILASYSGRVDLLRYLTGARKTCPM
jgi:hypothetical protein